MSGSQRGDKDGRGAGGAASLVRVGSQTPGKSKAARGRHVVLVPLRTPHADTGRQGGPAPFGHATASEREASPQMEILLQLETDKGTCEVTWFLYTRNNQRPRAEIQNFYFKFKFQREKYAKILWNPGPRERQ